MHRRQNLDLAASCVETFFRAGAEEHFIIRGALVAIEGNVMVRVYGGSPGTFEVAFCRVCAQCLIFSWFCYLCVGAPLPSQ